MRAIAASRIPTVSAVGHEIDVTLADLAADVRALTPSEAAERVVPAAEEISARMRGYQQRLRHAAHRRVMWLARALDGIAVAAAVSPAVRLGPRSQPPARRTGAARQFGRCGGLLHDREGRLATIAGKIESLSPLAVLARGYTITQDAKTGSGRPHARPTARRAIDRHSVRDGEAVSKVESIRANNVRIELDRSAAQLISVGTMSNTILDGQEETDAARRMSPLVRRLARRAGEDRRRAGERQARAVRRAGAVRTRREASQRLPAIARAWPSGRSSC